MRFLCICSSLGVFRDLSPIALDYTRWNLPVTVFPSWYESALFPIAPQPPVVDALGFVRKRPKETKERPAPPRTSSLFIIGQKERMHTADWYPGVWGECVTTILYNPYTSAKNIKIYIHEKTISHMRQNGSRGRNLRLQVSPEMIYVRTYIVCLSV